MSKWKTVKDNVSKLAWEHKHAPPPWMKDKECTPSSSLYTHPTTCSQPSKSKTSKEVSPKTVNRAEPLETLPNTSKKVDLDKFEVKNDHNGLKKSMSEVSKAPRRKFIQTPLIAKMDILGSKHNSDQVEGNIRQPSSPKDNVDIMKREHGLKSLKTQMKKGGNMQKRGEDITSPPWVKQSRIDKNETGFKTQAVDTVNFETRTVNNTTTKLKPQEKVISVASPFGPEKERLQYFKNFCGENPLDKRGNFPIDDQQSSHCPERKVSHFKRVDHLSGVDCLYCLASIEDPVELVSIFLLPPNPNIYFANFQLSLLKLLMSFGYIYIGFMRSLGMQSLCRHCH